MVNDRADDNTSRSGNIRNLWCTWDEDNLYLAITYQDFGPDEALAVYVDLDKSAEYEAFEARGGVMDGEQLTPEKVREIESF